MIPDILKRDEDSQAYRKNWAKLIQKIYEVHQSTLTKHSLPEPSHGRRGNSALVEFTACLATFIGVERSVLVVKGAINNRSRINNRRVVYGKWRLIGPFRYPSPPRGLEGEKQPRAAATPEFGGDFCHFPGRKIASLLASGAPRGPIRFPPPGGVSREAPLVKTSLVWSPTPI